MPWVSRATAIKPDAAYVLQDNELAKFLIVNRNSDRWTRPPRRDYRPMAVTGMWSEASSVAWLAGRSLSYPPWPIDAPLQHGGRVVPKRCGTRGREIRTRETDIREHPIVVLAKARKLSAMLDTNGNLPDLLNQCGQRLAGPKQGADSSR
jgi:hypothetical protein